MSEPATTMELRSFVAESVWVVQRPLRLFGLEIGTRMTVVRLADGALWVHSPVDPSEALRRQLDALGPVRYVVAPSKLHHLFVNDFCAHYPQARVFGSPALPEKRPDIELERVLGDEPEPEWAGQLEQARVLGHYYLDEVVFCHRASRTLILADLMESVHADAPLASRIVSWFGGIYERPGPPLDMKLTFTDRQAARATIERVLSWDFDRVVLAHGHLIEADGKAVLENAYRFLLEE